MKKVSTIEEGRERLRKKLKPGLTLESVVLVDFSDPQIVSNMKRGVEEIEKSMQRRRPTNYELSQTVINY